ncbi:hypothetical protein ARALYDRAFT_892514 [Arabidopsis lyrata subsp. lyrata]|uniref:Uncharacterized protein n=1 Tax=Arabidopsis lyrata subsp. lyrata TaxID=81972 RepID=D7KM72_ARALL|nr:uncharacterized protein LOC9327883 [Arabidopsis lyrata subsp. lyrata]EFH70754.1 hypothetical protein ARALYDRAFT_892514 [Arabidopsis lyrata subsp. lyrata]|eukprot:XP_002894495.1 uncharacterized protein LOC9327883 [Arabidopsis lyrata subsp. lyrata]
MAPWTDILTNAAIFVIIQALAFLIIFTSSDIFSSKIKMKAKKRSFGFKLSRSISHLFALTSDDVSRADEEEVAEEEASFLLSSNLN